MTYEIRRYCARPLYRSRYFERLPWRNTVLKTQQPAKTYGLGRLLLFQYYGSNIHELFNLVDF